MVSGTKPLAVVTGASSGIGYEFAKICVDKGYDLVIAADEPAIEAAATKLRRSTIRVTPIQADLATQEGVERLIEATDGRPISLLFANAGRGLGGAFLDQDFHQVQRVIATNITGTIYLIQRVARAMRDCNQGRILITGSIAGFTPGPFNAVYNASKSFIDSFSFALRNELKDTRITVTCLMPGGTETEFFKRAGMMDTEIGTHEKDDPADVAKVGFDAMMRGDGDIVSGWKNKLKSALANITPAETLAEKHRETAEPGSARK
jgi:short-subunit dehydrogenase